MYEECLNFFFYLSKIMMKYPVIQLSGFSESECGKLSAIIRQLGGEIITSEVFDSKCTHLICEKIMCGEKFLTSCARGLWVLTPQFIYDSAKKGAWVVEYDYEWTASKAEPKDSSQVQMCQAPSRWRKIVKQSKCHAFHQWKVAILVKNHKKRKIYHRLLCYGGAVLYMLKLPIKNVQKVSGTVTHIFVDSSFWEDVVVLQKNGIQCLHVTYIRDYLIKDSPPDLSRYKLCRSGRWKVCVGLKRKVPLSSTLESVLTCRKYLRLTQQTNGWQPLSFANGLIVNTDQHKVSDSVSCIPMQGSLAEMIHCCLEEEFNYHEGLIMALNFISAGAYLPPQTCYFFMKDILLKNKSADLNLLCYEVLMKNLSLFPPGPQFGASRQIYLQTLLEAERNGHYNSKWEFLKDVIMTSLQVDKAGPDHDMSEGSLLLLKFLLAVFEQDFSEHMKSRKQHANNEGIKVPPCLLQSVMWGSSYGQTVNKSCTELKDFLRKVLNVDLPELYRKEVLSLVLSLISMVAEYLRQTCLPVNSSLKDYLSLPLQGMKLNLFIHELGKEIYYGCQEDLSKFDLVLSEFNLPWLAMSVSHVLAQSFHDTMDLYCEGIGNTFTLSALIKKYLSILCCINYQLTENHNPIQKGTRKDPISTTNEQMSTCGNNLTSTPLKSRNQPNHVSPPDLSPVGKSSLTRRQIMNINKKNHKGETLLHLACMRNSVDKVRELLKIPGIDVNASDNNGWTPLHEACNHNNPECVMELLNFQPVRTINTYFSPVNGHPKQESLNVYAQAEDLLTPLHDAVMSDSVACARLLLKYKGSKLLKMKTDSGSTPLDLATTDEMQAVLNAYNSDVSISSDRTGQTDTFDTGFLTAYPSNSEYVPKLTYAQLEKYCCFVFHLIRCYLSVSQLPYVAWLSKYRQRRPNDQILDESQALCSQIGSDMLTESSQATLVLETGEWSEICLEDIAAIYNTHLLEIKLRGKLTELPDHLKRLFNLFDSLD